MADKNLTITDIAYMAGVSKTTVSRYLNGKYEFMSEPTRDRIRAVIDLAGYQPNNLARSLKSQRSMLVGMVVADIESPFSSASIKSVGDALAGSGYGILIANSDNSIEQEQSHIKAMLAQQVDGLIVNTTRMDNPFLIGLANSGTPTILLDRFVNDYKFDIAYIDNTAPVNAAVDHLADMGYSRAAFFSQPFAQVSPRRLRREAFLNRLASMGVAQPERYAFEVDISDPATLRGAVQRLLDLCRDEKAPPAIIAANGVTLMHTARTLRTMGLQVPRDLGLCGYDDWGWASDLAWADMMDVGLTTLTATLHDLGALTARALLQRMADPASEKQCYHVPAHLTARGSTRLKG